MPKEQIVFKRGQRVRYQSSRGEPAEGKVLRQYAVFAGPWVEIKLDTGVTIKSRPASLTLI